MLAVLPTDHPFAEYATIPLAALATEPFILLEEGHYYEPLDAFKSVGTAPNINYTGLHPLFYARCYHPLIDF